MNEAHEAYHRAKREAREALERETLERETLKLQAALIGRTIVGVTQDGYNDAHVETLTLALDDGAKLKVEQWASWADSSGLTIEHEPAE